jgi:hypothetical protein
MGGGYVLARIYDENDRSVDDQLLLPRRVPAQRERL